MYRDFVREISRWWASTTRLGKLADSVWFVTVAAMLGAVIVIMAGGPK
jgi:hypothetical protein